jgi:putative ABC transport system permease protein
MAATVALMIVSTIAFGLFPALHAARGGVEAALRAEGRGTTAGNRRWANLLVGVQIALAMVLLVGSFLLADSFARLSRVDVGFDAAGVLTVPLSLPEPRYPEQTRPAFFDAAVARVAAVPGVESAAATTTNPFAQWGYVNDVTPEERVATTPASGLLQAGWRTVTPGFFQTLRVPLLAGRTFDGADRDGAPRVVIVSRTLAERLWPGMDAVGHRLYWGGLTGRTRTVVGVVGDIRDVRLDAPATPMLYLPYAQLPLADMTLLVRTRAGAAAAEAVRRELRAMDTALPIPEVRPLAANRASAMSAPRLRTAALAVFGIAALLLASVGLYGVVAFTVSQRTREIAIRVALGARPGQMTQLFFRRGAVLAALGTAAGLFLAWAAAGVMQALLFETASRDPRVFALATAVLTAITLLASYLPARRAAALDPIRGLTSE